MCICTCVHACTQIFCVYFHNEHAYTLTYLAVKARVHIHIFHFITHTSLKRTLLQLHTHTAAYTYISSVLSHKFDLSAPKPFAYTHSQFHQKETHPSASKRTRTGTKRQYQKRFEILSNRIQRSAYLSRIINSNTTSPLAHTHARSPSHHQNCIMYQYPITFRQPAAFVSVEIPQNA